MDPQGERVAHNQSAFRSANERIEEAAAGLPQARFLCECPDPGCTVTVSLGLEAYEGVRANPRWFIAAPGHEQKSRPWGEAVDRRDGYVVVEKLGEAGAIAEQTAERAGESVDG